MKEIESVEKGGNKKRILLEDNRKEYLYYLFVIICLILIFFTGTRNLGLQQRIRIVDDEFGYWGIAAHLAGYKWSDLLSITGYYSFGYSFILVPLWWMYRLGMKISMVYQAAILLNVCMAAGSFLISLAVGKKMFPEVDKFYRLMVSTISIFYYGYITQMGNAWAEIYLVLMFWCVVYAMFQVLNEEKMVWHILLIIFTASIFSIHMRALSVVVSVVIVYVLNLVTTEKKDIKKLAVIFFVILIVAAGVLVMRNYTQEVIYGGNELQNHNDFSGVSNKAKAIFSIGGIIDFAASIAGKVYYVGVATFGIGIFAMVAMVKEILNCLWKVIKTKKLKLESRQWMNLFLFMAAFATILVDAVFKISPYYSTGSVSNLADNVFYGRYVDYVIGMLLVCGFIYLWKEKVHVLDICFTILIFIVCAVVTQKYCDLYLFYNGGGGVRTTAVPGASYILNGSIEHLAAKGFFTACIGAVIIAIVLFGGKKKYRNVRMLLFTFAFCLWGMISGNRTVEQVVEGKSDKQKTVESIAQLVRDIDCTKVKCIFNGDTSESGIKILQWSLPEYPIEIISKEEFENIEEDALYLVHSDDDELLAEMSIQSNYIYDSGLYAVFYNAEPEHLQKYASEAAKTVNPQRKYVNMATAVAEYGYIKPNGSIYLSAQRMEAYLTEKTGLVLSDGVYEFIVSLEYNYGKENEDIGYITITDTKGQYLSTRVITEDDFSKDGKGKIVVSMPVQDYVEPIIGVYTYGNGAMKVTGMLCRQICGNLMVETGRDDEWNEVIKVLNGCEFSADEQIWYVDGDSSAKTGFPDFTNVNTELEHDIAGYISGEILVHREDIMGDYLVVEKTGVCEGIEKDKDILYETTHYYLIKN